MQFDNKVQSQSSPPHSTFYIPVTSPPTPAPSPGPGSFTASNHGGDYSGVPHPLLTLALPPAASPSLRLHLLSSLLASCTPAELLFISQTITPLLKRDFLAALPVELALHVLSFVCDADYGDDDGEGVKTLGRAMRVSRRWYGIVKDESVWRRMCGVYGFGGGRGGSRDQYDRGSTTRTKKNKGKKAARDDDGFVSSTSSHPTDSSSTSSTRRRRPPESNSLNSNPPSSTFSYRRHFRTSYIIRTNWRHGGTLLQTHRLPITNPSHAPPVGPAVVANTAHVAPIPTTASSSDASATVTSLALDSSYVVVGLANSNIKVYSTRTGVLARTLVGHESGVWCVCLVSRGGWTENAGGGVEWVKAKSSKPKSKSKIRIGEVKEGERAPDTSKRKQKHIHGGTAIGNIGADVTDDESTDVFAQTHNDIQRKKERLLRRIYADDGDGDGSLGSPGTSSASRQIPSTRLLRTGFAGLSLGAGGDGTHIVPSESLVGMVSRPMRVALGLESESENEEEEEGQEEEEDTVFDEDAFEAQTQWRQTRQHDSEQNGRTAAEEPAAERGRQYAKGQPSNPSFASTGWGQPNAIIVSGGCDKFLRVWDAKSGQCIYTLPGHTATIRSLRTLHNRPIAITGSRDSTLRVWDIQRGRCERVLEGHDGSVRCLDVCGGRVVSGSYDCTVRVWDIDTGECLHVLSGHFHQIYSVAFDGVRIASGGLDTTVRVWDADTGQCIALLQGHTALVCQLQLSSPSPASPPLLCTGGSDGRVITFSLLTFLPLHRLAAHDSSVTSLQFDNEFLVTGGTDGRVKIWDVRSGAYVREVGEGSEGVWKVAFGGGEREDGGAGGGEGPGRDVLAVMCKRHGKSAVEIWSMRPKARARNPR